MAGVLTTVLDKTGFRGRQGKASSLSQGRASVLTHQATRSWHLSIFWGRELSSSRGRKGQRSDADPCEADSDPVAHGTHIMGSCFLPGRGNSLST